jgi:hypothetical protein
MFRVVLLPSSGAHTTVSTASVICHTVTAICRYRGSVGTGLIVHSTVRLNCVKFHLVVYILEYKRVTFNLKGPMI